MSEQEMMVQGTENVEPTTEEAEVSVEQVQEEPAVESAKVYTEEEFQRRLDKKVSRREAKIRKEYERKYGNLENVLRAGTGKESVEEITDTFSDFYKQKGIEIPQTARYTSNDIKVLASAEANEIIKAGFEDVIEEVDRLADLGIENMDEREREVFKQLAEYRTNTEQSRELAKIGVTEDVYTSADFQDFAKKFSSTTPITEIYNIYNKTKPQKQIQTAGSMRTTEVQNNDVKDFYSFEEASKFTKADFDKNPKLYEAVQKSMTKWGK